ncbi:M23 family metallopeptidase [Kutzneria sp. NPDC052558]|uniref:M23 family metallopeptidase n=1 Tax=Kutzneria sp. NPDC052558 TaxID=3364121 RepID=UPI0037C8E5B1
MPTALALTTLLLATVVSARPSPAGQHTRPPSLLIAAALPGTPAPARVWPPSARAQPPPRAVRYGWPLAPPHPVLRPFQRPSSPYGPGHRGVDLGANTGEPVLAAADGVVSFAGWLATRGVVAVAHMGGIRTTYEPVQPSVTVGQRVRRGEEVGRLTPGHEGCEAACLHWGARRGTEYLDPLGLLSTQRVRLFPWREPPPE